MLERHNMVSIPIFSLLVTKERKKGKKGKRALLRALVGVKQIEVMNINLQKPIAFSLHSVTVGVGFMLCYTAQHEPLCSLSFTSEFRLKKS